MRKTYKKTQQIEMLDKFVFLKSEIPSEDIWDSFLQLIEVIELRIWKVIAIKKGKKLFFIHCGRK